VGICENVHRIVFGLFGEGRPGKQYLGGQLRNSANIFYSVTFENKVFF